MAISREREREIERLNRNGRNPGLVDPDGESFVWGSAVIDADGGIGLGEAFEDLDKSQERLAHP